MGKLGIGIGLGFGALPPSGLPFQDGGSIIATSFADGPDGQVLTSDLDGGAFIGRRGDASGPDSADPAWSATGADFVAGHRFTNVGSSPSGSVEDFRFIQDTGVFTIYLSFNSDNVGTLQTIFDNKDSSVANTGSGCLWNKSITSFVFAAVNGVPAFYLVSATAAAGAWHGVVITGNGSACKLYLNGSAVASPDDEAVIVLDTPTASKDVMRIGRGSGTSLNSFDGKMGYLTIHDTTHDEVAITAQREFLTNLMDARGVPLAA